MVLYALGKLKDLSSIDFIIQKIEEMIGEIEEKYTDIVPYVNALGMYNLKEPTEYLIKLFTSENKSVRLLSTNGISNLNNPELKELFIPLLNSQYEEVVKISQGFLNRIKKEAK